MWYAVCGDSFMEADDEGFDRGWTVSLDPKEPGWETDGGIRRYGRSRREAEYLAACANWFEQQPPREIRSLSECRGTLNGCLRCHGGLVACDQRSE